MNLDDMTAKLKEASAVIPGKKLKIDFGDAGAILLDGVANVVTNDAAGAADTSISISWNDWEALAAGTLDPMSAFMQGKLKIQGDMGLAMQMQAMLGKLKNA